MADVVAILHAVEMDADDRVVGALLGLLDVVAKRRDAQHAATGGKD